MQQKRLPLVSSATDEAETQINERIVESLTHKSGAKRPHIALLNSYRSAPQFLKSLLVSEMIAQAEAHTQHKANFIQHTAQRAE